MSTFGNTLAAIDYHNHREQLKDTWGHLAPIKDKTYRGRVLLAIGCFGDDDLNPTVLESEFNGLGSSPWFFESLTEFLSDWQCDKPRSRRDVGTVWEWRGTFCNFEFKGAFRKMKLA